MINKILTTLYLVYFRLIADISLLMNLERQFPNIELMIQMQDAKRETLIHLKPELLTMENGKEVSVMASVSRNGPMAPYMKANGKIIELMVKENSLTLMVISTKANEKGRQH